MDLPLIAWFWVREFWSRLFYSLMSRLDKLSASLVLFSYLVIGCSPAVTTTPMPTPHVIRIGYSPSLESWLPDLSACASQITSITLALYPRESQGFSNTSDDDINLLHSTPSNPQISDGAFITQIGIDPLIWITHPDNPISQIDASQLRKMYEGKANTWDELIQELDFADTTVLPWVYAQSSVLYQPFREVIWSQRALPPQAYIAPNPAAMLEAVSSNPGAIGYIPQSWLDGTSTRINPILVQPEFTLDVLAISQTEPQGDARQLLLCLRQTRSGE
jgi:hypothetical protein